ncbi:hypothetical protein Bra3105_17785 [Brachybacterium halotolerans subsp. kimchii]|uniref:hypothetical protein n=1 Tax=Brachybacterium halotolerans TaxID=2795215 RepID=UPI001E2E1DFB|nr:hypothetical protein [Brachybacterium halotolerans]UEJ82656.1 hypothetical protein Bra3105_17785 [Brachybacterium halotolerans subsp. kimchii]
MSFRQIQHLGDGWDIKGRTIKLTPPTPRYDGTDVIIRVDEHVTPTHPSKPEGHLIAGALLSNDGNVITRRAEMILPDGLPIEFLDDVAGDEKP